MKYEYQRTHITLYTCIFYLRNANTRDIMEEEHKVPNRVITYFNLYTYVASICRFLTRYGFTPHDYLTRYAYYFFVLIRKLKSLCICIFKTRISKYKIISFTYTNIMNSSSVFFKFKEQMHNIPLSIITIQFFTRASQTFPPHKN